MNAIDFIVKEHDQVRKLISEIRAEKDLSKLKHLFDTIKILLIRHETMEQKLWYPALKKENDFDDIIEHLTKEEKEAEKKIKKLTEGKVDEDWKKELLKFMDDVEHHAEDEEEKLLPKVKEEVSEEKLIELGNEFQEYVRQAKSTLLRH